jgi:phosphonate transport system substrate-binding protein
MKRRQFIWFTLLFATSCKASTLTAESNVRKMEKIRFAVTDVLEVEKLLQNYGNFRSALETVLETKVEFFPVQSLTAAAVALQSGDVDLVLTGPSEYVIIHARTNAVPLMGITRPNYHSLIVVPVNSPIQSVADLNGKTIALSDIGSTSGHLGPIKMIVDAGLNPKSDVKTTMLGDEGSVAALKSGQVDAWGGSAIDYEQLINQPKNFESGYRILATGLPLPNDIFVASSQLDPELIADYKQRMIDRQETLIQALVRGEKTHKYQGSKLVPASDSDYNMIRQVYQEMGESKLIE